MYRETPTLEELKTLYDSELYKNMLSEFAERSNRKLENIEPNSTELDMKLVFCQRRYQMLDTPFEKILPAFEENRDKFLNYQIAATAFFGEKDKNIEFGFSETDIECALSIDTIYLLERFCEFYLLLSDNKTRLMQYIGGTKTLFIVKYVEKITQLYHETIAGNAQPCGK